MSFSLLLNILSSVMLKFSKSQGLFLFHFCVLVFCGLLSTGFMANAQGGAFNANDLSQVRSENISDDQLKSYIAKGKERGLSAEEVMQMASQRGLPASEAAVLMQRVRDLESSGQETITSVDRSRQEPTPLPVKDQAIRKSDTLPSPIFGSSLFSREGLNFEPSMHVPTPVNYVLGAGDELIVDIWGAATNVYQLEVGTEGTVVIANLGPVYVQGLTIEEASRRILQKLKTLYQGLDSDGSDQRTFARVSLGRVRSIQVTLIGEVQTPGNYTVSSLATVFNVLYKAGGPNQIGSYRNIEIIRSGSKVANFDLYDLLIKADQSGNIRLQDQDLIKVNPYERRVAINGEIKRPGLYEIKEDESAVNLIDFAGKYTDYAYTRQMKVYRNTDSEREILTVKADQLERLSFKTGDSLVIDRILDRYANRVVVSGAVWRPGEYELTDSMTLHDLILKAEGVKPNAFMSRAVINRLKDNYEFTIVPFNVKEVLTHPELYDIVLKNEDHIEIKTIQEMREDFSVSISGAVQHGGSFEYREGMTLGDLLLNAQGFKESASEARIEIYRRIVGEAAPDRRGKDLAESFVMEVPRDLSLNQNDRNFVLMPFDQVYVRHRPDYQVQKGIRIEGEVMYPGSYTLKSREERISDLVKRSGGLTAEAFIQGAVLIRQPSRKTTPEAAIEGDMGEIIKLEENKESYIGIDLARILKNPGSSEDLFLMPDDIIRIPQELQTVKVSGAVLRNTEVRFKDGKGFKHYISRAGGLANNARKNKGYVVYANGDVAASKRFLCFSRYPDVERGAEIIIPEKEQRERLNAGERISILSAVVSMAAIVVTAITRL